VVSQSTFFFTNFKGRVGGGGGGRELGRGEDNFFYSVWKSFIIHLSYFDTKDGVIFMVTVPRRVHFLITNVAKPFPFFIPSFVKICLYPIMTFVLQVFSIAYKIRENKLD
jgi:hypothetical protein